MIVLRNLYKIKYLKLPVKSKYQQRGLWLWFYNLFNRVDQDRLQRFGPDRTCAEWILKNGGAVRFKVQNDIINDYNDLVPETSALVKDQVVEVYANEATINDYGFSHFKGCNYITKITFIACRYIGDNGLESLQTYLKNNLRHLEIKSCHGITEKGILSLSELRGLQNLTLYNLAGVRDKERCEMVLKEALRNTECDIKF